MTETQAPKTMAELQADYTALASQAGDKGFQVKALNADIELAYAAMMELQKQAKLMHDAEVAAQQAPMEAVSGEVVTEVPSDALPVEGA